MGKFRIKRPSAGYTMTSVNLGKEDRVILDRIMKKENMRMGEVVRAAIRRLGEGYQHTPEKEA